MARDAIGSPVSHASHVDDAEQIPEGFSFRFLRRVLGMSSSDLSPKILRSGSWSTATMRSLQPSTYEVSCFVQCVSYGEGFTFDRRISRLSWVSEATAY